MAGDSLRKRKIAVLGSRSVGQDSSTFRLQSSTQRFTRHAHDREVLACETIHRGWLSLIPREAIAENHCKSHFLDAYYPTIESTFAKSVTYKGVEYDCQIIDTAGQVSAQESIDHHAYRTPHSGRTFSLQPTACNWHTWLCIGLFYHLSKLVRHDTNRV